MALELTHLGHLSDERQSPTSRKNTDANIQQSIFAGYDDGVPMFMTKETSVFDEIKNNKYGKFFTNILFWNRIMVLVLTLFLLFLSAAYCTAQLFEAKLDLITQCEPKT